MEAKNQELAELKDKMVSVESKNKSIQQASEEYQRMIKVKSNELQDKQDELFRVRKEISTTNLKKNTSDADILRREYDSKIKRIEQ